MLKPIKKATKRNEVSLKYPRFNGRHKCENEQVKRRKIYIITDK